MLLFIIPVNTKKDLMKLNIRNFNINHLTYSEEDEEKNSISRSNNFNSMCLGNNHISNSSNLPVTSNNLLESNSTL